MNHAYEDRKCKLCKKALGSVVVKGGFCSYKCRRHSQLLDKLREVSR